MADEARRFGRFALEGRDFIGELSGDSVLELGAVSIVDLAGSGAGETVATHPLDGLRALAPVPSPSKIVCVGLNYRSHIREMGWEMPKTPIIFSKPSSAVIGPGDNIVLPPASSHVDYEGESAIVIGRTARNALNGLDHIFGYTALNDVTARDLQKTDPDWTRAKGFDTFAPMGPFVSTRSPSVVATRLNGREVQRSPLSDRVFDDARLVEYISTVMTLLPGDVIATGTPSGISPVNPGDVVEVELDGIGCLRNPVIGA
jgi:2-keto-4-pentenoate hydratase/2-oxohepta-3-ene-1,7-dioic acid hydratase in catechol pathway